MDAYMSEGDAKLWGVVEDIRDEPLHQRFATGLFEQTGLDVRGRKFDHFYAANITGAAAVEMDGGLAITIWKPGDPERTVRKD